MKLRYRSPAVPAEVTEVEAGFVLELAEHVDAVAPGQVAVLYDDDAVVVIRAGADVRNALDADRALVRRGLGAGAGHRRLRRERVLLSAALTGRKNVQYILRC